MRRAGNYTCFGGGCRSYGISKRGPRLAAVIRPFRYLAIVTFWRIEVPIDPKYEGGDFYSMDERAWRPFRISYRVLDLL